MGLREREISAPRADLAKIGREGFDLIDKFFRRAPAARRAATTERPALPKPPRKTEQPPWKKKEKQAVVVTSDHVAKTRGGMVITTWRAYAKRM